MHNVSIQEVRVEVPMPNTDTIVVPQVAIQPNNSREQQILHDEPAVVEPQAIALRRSQRDRKSAISDEYVVYLQESEFDLGIDNDPVSFKQAMECDDSTKWLDAMKEELKSMDQN